MRILFFIILILNFKFYPSQSASLNCDKAKSETEKTICNDIELSTLDKLMSEQYLKLLKDNCQAIHLISKSIEFIGI